MDKGIYVALSGGLARGHELEIISNNLANVNTPGFKRDTGTFHEYVMELRRSDSPGAVETEIKSMTMLDGRPPGDKSFVELDSIYTDFGQGSLTRTNNDLDVAIQGEGFFEVLTDNGVRYSRQGSFAISNEGMLVNKNGHPVLSKGNGTPEERVIRLQGGSVDIVADGTLFQDSVQVSQLSVQEFHEPQWLEKIGNTYFQNEDPANLKGASSSALRHGYLEGSNVDPIMEMTRLIEASRAYESHMQAIKTYQEVDEKTANEIAKV